MLTEDIVIRLRGQRTNGVLCEQAADEIERLRAELAYWHRVAETEHIRLTNELKAARGE